MGHMHPVVRLEPSMVFMLGKFYLSGNKLLCLLLAKTCF